MFRYDRETTDHQYQEEPPAKIDSAFADNLDEQDLKNWLAKKANPDHEWGPAQEWAAANFGHDKWDDLELPDTAAERHEETAELSRRAWQNSWSYR